MTAHSPYAIIKINNALQSFGESSEERLDYILFNSLSEHKSHKELGDLYSLYRDEINKIVELVLVHEYSFLNLFPEVYSVSNETARIMLAYDSVLYSEADHQIKEYITDFHYKIYDFANVELEEFFSKRNFRLAGYLKTVFKDFDSRNQLYRFIRLSKPILFVYYLAGLCMGIYRCKCSSVADTIDSALNKYLCLPNSVGDEKLRMQNLYDLCRESVKLDHSEHTLYAKFTDPVIGTYDMDRHADFEFSNSLAEDYKTYPSAYFYMKVIEDQLRYERGWVLSSFRSMAYFLTGLLQHEWNKRNGKQTVVPEPVV